MPETLFTVCGIVEHGNQKGRDLGFPTANLSVQFSDRIPSGVYLSQTTTACGKRVWGVTNVGVRPTMTDSSVVVAETHLFCDSCDLYGTKIQVDLISFLREEIHFSKPEELVMQIRADVKLAKELIEHQKSV